MLNMAEGLARIGALAASPVVDALARAFAEAGFELALVGGPVRDALLGRPTNDLDFTTNARPDDILRIVKPISSAQWDIGRDFGTIGARVRGEQVEITTYRADEYDGATRKPVVAFGDDLEGDLARRDFTVNAMALRLPGPALVDPTGGVEDLVAGILRTPVDPAVSFGDDPLRMLRAARFSAQLGFDVDPATVAAMTERAETLSIVSPERIQGELVKLLQADDPARGIRLLVDTGLMAKFLPEVPALRLEVDEHHHHKDVYEHSLTVVRQAIQLERERTPDGAPDVRLRLAALLHDIGKPATRRLEDGGGVTFHHHDVKGARLA
ncbi:CCA tRNA nucleotidyltransferase, partial [Microbacterium sp. zg.Y909]|uniref:CCA tRNA nucleotidyltransferase n=1 Tax=Microbacterium sp. zg.Y909 TaxID=2969413 RepID=UPI00214AAD3A